MSKKFFTLLAGFLLASGAFFSAAADEATTSYSRFSEAVDKYVVVKVHNNGVATWTGSWSMTVVDGKLTLNSESANTNPATTAEVWKVEAVTVDGTSTSTPGYTLTNGDGLLLSFDYDETNDVYTFNSYGQGDYYVFNISSSNQLKLTGSSYYLTQDADLILTLTKTSDEQVLLFAAPTETYSADELNDILTTGFGLQICYSDKKSTPTYTEYSSIEGNPFTGVLTAEEIAGDSVKLYQSDGKQIVLTTSTWNLLSSIDHAEGYKFAAMTAKEIASATNIIAEGFVITAPSIAEDGPLEVAVTIGNSDENDGTVYELVVFGVDGKYYLTVAESETANTAEYTYTMNTKENTYVRFGVSNAIDYAIFYDKLWNITRVAIADTTTRYAAAPNCYSTTYVPVAQVTLDYPEGQWLYSGNYIFTNRESGNTVTIPSLRSTDTDGVYTDGTYNYTIAAVGTPGHSYTGYFNDYTADELKQKAFFIGTPIASTGDTVYMAKNASDQIIWTTDVTEAIEMRLTKVATDGYSEIRHITEYLGLDASGNVVTKYDTLSYYRYNFAEVATDMVLGYDSENKVYMLKDASVWYTEEEYSDDQYWGLSLALKNKAADTYNLVMLLSPGIITKGETYYTVSGTKLTAADTFLANNYDNTLLDVFCIGAKLYGAHNSNRLVRSDYLYENTENDLFTLIDADANMYRPVAALDTITIFRDADNNYVMYEKGDYLGIEHFLDPTYAEKNGAMLADTAAGYGTWRPEYLLAVEATIENDGWTCPYNAEHNTAAWREANGGHCADAVQDRAYVTGRYLVNLKDSSDAYIEANGSKNNPFINEYYTSSQPYYKLAFVSAVHVGDSLIIVSTNDTIDLSDNTVDKYCTFAFRYTDANRDAFRIETLYEEYVAEEDGFEYEGNTYDKGEVYDWTRGYIKYHNGVPVVTPQASEAEVFDLNVLEGVVPTANEAIEAATGVKVIGGKGTITVQGASGKAVTITNILGKTVTSATLTSDNATLTVPAGIVVVAVEGEDAVKVIVK